jgi:ferredoxin
MFDPDLWLRQQLWEQLWKGPGAVSTYWSIAIQLVCVALSALGSTELQGPNLWILSIIILLGVLLILSDEIASCRNHRLGLLRFSAAKSRDRIEKLEIKSKQVDRFLNAFDLGSCVFCPLCVETCPEGASAHSRIISFSRLIGIAPASMPPSRPGSRAGLRQHARRALWVTVNSFQT